jgi:hypothetical protein
LECVIFTHEVLGAKLNNSSFQFAEHCSIKLLRYLHKINIHEEINCDILKLAIKSNSLECIKFVHEIMHADVYNDILKDAEMCYEDCWKYVNEVILTN